MNKTDFYKVLEAVEMKKKRIAIALGHDALGTTLPEQKEATRRAADTGRLSGSNYTQ